ncbi:MAG: DUF2993 domain-containing protein [Gloeocapsa sp. UFS-A4-WI-NPMV-4B04]|nr:DUF2993 domain-containing protein [Gloeocapsa sp. UFS-A4-WI-NPMV-4B04]
MAQEKGRFGEQAINKIAEMALASQLGEVERVEVQINTDLNKLAHGEVECINIKINGVPIQQDLTLEELQLEINQVTVKPLSALLGKIKLTKPAEGIVRIVINENSLNRAFNSKSFDKYLHQSKSFVDDKQQIIHVQQVQCFLLADGNIAFNSKLILDKTQETKLVAFTAIPCIANNGEKIVLQNMDYLEGKEIAPELTAALITQMSEFLSLRKFEQKGMLLRIQQIDVTVGKLTLQANAYIEQFPSS